MTFSLLLQYKFSGQSLQLCPFVTLPDMLNLLTVTSTKSILGNDAIHLTKTKFHNVLSMLMVFCWAAGMAITCAYTQSHMWPVDHRLKMLPSKNTRPYLFPSPFPEKHPDIKLNSLSNVWLQKSIWIWLGKGTPLLASPLHTEEPRSQHGPLCRLSLVCLFSHYSTILTKG